jgi:hypothetical protein
MDSAYVTKVRKWLELEERIDKTKSKLKNITEEKKALEDSILEYITTNDMQNVQINIPNGNIKFVETKVPQTLSLKYIKDVLSDFFHQNSKCSNADDIYKFIVADKASRTKKRCEMKKHLTS